MRGTSATGTIQLPPSMLLFVLFVSFGFWVIHSVAWLTPGGIWGPFWVLGVKPRSIESKANTLPALLLFQLPHTVDLLINK